MHLFLIIALTFISHVSTQIISYIATDVASATATLGTNTIPILGANFSVLGITVSAEANGVMDFEQLAPAVGVNLETTSLVELLNGTNTDFSFTAVGSNNGVAIATDIEVDLFRALALGIATVDYSGTNMTMSGVGTYPTSNPSLYTLTSLIITYAYSSASVNVTGDPLAITIVGIWGDPLKQDLLNAAGAKLASEIL